MPATPDHLHRTRTSSLAVARVPGRPAAVAERTVVQCPTPGGGR